MDSEKASSLTTMDKVRIVIKYKELKENEKEAYLKKQGIDKEKLESYQREAASLLGGEPKPSRPKSPCEELIEKLHSDDEDIRREAAKSLGKMRHRSIPALDALVDRLLNDRIDFVKSWSAWALTRIAPRNRVVIEGFLQSIAENEHAENVREWCTIGLSVSESDHVRDCLLEIMHTGEPYARISAIKILSNMKVRSIRFISALKEASSHANESLQREANKTLAKVQLDDK